MSNVVLCSECGIEINANKPHIVVVYRQEPAPAESFCDSYCICLYFNKGDPSSCC